MDSGIHIGLAAWLHHRCDGEGFPAWPSAPTALRLSRLEDAKVPEDMARLAEFSRLVNFVVRPGMPAQPFHSTPLWEIHANILSRMDFAERAWTDAENTEFLAARATLYGSEGMTPLYRLYQEYRAAYQDLLTASTPVAELREAMVAWELEGGKSVIEAALATIERLTSRSTLSAVQAERDQLMLLPVDPSGAAYAMTGFAPVSALDESGWIGARVDLSDIDGAVARAPQSAGANWINWRRGKTGKLTFRFTILFLDRDWFTPLLYTAFDWTLSGGEVVSDGAAQGLMPAYPARVYVVRDVVLKPNPAKPLQPVRPKLPRPIIQPYPAVVKLSTKSLGSSARTTPLAATNIPANGVVRSTLPAASLTWPTVAAGLRLSAKPVAQLRPGTIDLVSSLTVRNRLSAAHRIVAHKPPSNPQPPDSTLWAVGFGCERLPKAPNPHSGYSWT